MSRKLSKRNWFLNKKIGEAEGAIKNPYLLTNFIVTNISQAYLIK